MTNNPEKNMKIFEEMLLDKGVRGFTNVKEVAEILDVSVEIFEKVSSCMGDSFLERHWSKDWNDSSSKYANQLGLSNNRGRYKAIQIIGTELLGDGGNSRVVCEHNDDMQLATLLDLLSLRISYKEDTYEVALKIHLDIINFFTEIDIPELRKEWDNEIENLSKYMKELAVKLENRN